MASEIDRILERASAPLGGATTTGMADQLRRLTGQFRQLQTVQEAVAEALRNAPQRAPEFIQSRSSATGASGGGSSVLGFVGAGLGLSPLISGVLRLFGGGGGGSDPPPLMKFGLPPSLQVSAGVSGAGGGAAFGVDAGQGGLPRAVVESRAPQITVQVQAMDSQSFLDRSDDIARAVRQAMLESNVLNDVVREA